VGSYPTGASPYGVLDLSGNVWEWTRSEYKAYPYVPTDGRESMNATAKASREVRGGAFRDSQGRARAACRAASGAGRSGTVRPPHSRRAHPVGLFADRPRCPP
jgi:formylglycine-generating enzyme required for sulfatase activity